MTPEREEAARLLGAARSDQRALEVLATDPQQGNDVVGFHAQQAVEKAIKAVLAAAGAEIPFTHDLGFLLEALDGQDFNPQSWSPDLRDSEVGSSGS